MSAPYCSLTRSRHTGPYGTRTIHRKPRLGRVAGVELELAAVDVGQPESAQTDLGTVTRFELWRICGAGLVGATGGDVRATDIDVELANEREDLGTAVASREHVAGALWALWARGRRSGWG